MTRHHRNEIVIVKNPGFWTSYMLLEKALLILCIASTFAVAAPSEPYHYAEPLCSLEATTKGQPAIYFNSPTQESTPTTSVQDGDVCITEECTKTATRILDSLDESVDPCEHFYEFACGNFIKNTVIPDDKSNVDSFTLVNDILLDQLRQIINEEPKPDEIRPFTLLKYLNRACLNKNISEERGNAPVIDLLDEFGGWPVIKGDEWVEAGWNWVDTVKHFRQVGLGANLIIFFYIQKDFKNSTINTIYIDQSSTELGPDLLTKGIEEKFVNAYYDLMVSLAVALGADQQKAEKEMMDVLNFEIALSNISWLREKRRDANLLHNPTSIRELQEKYPYLLWLEYINALLPKSAQVDKNEVVNVVVPSFFEKLGEVLQSVPKHTIANYFGFRAALTAAGASTDKLFNLILAFNAAISGQQEPQPRWKECVAFTIQSLPIGVGALYVRKFFKDDARQESLKLVTNLREEFMHLLSEIPWMDDKTKIAAIEKAKSITNHIGYPDELGDDKKIEEFYGELGLEPDNLLKNKLRLLKFDTDTEFKRLSLPVNKTDWVTHSKPASVEAAYSILENSIQFSAAILQDRFFSPDRPHYMNYGAIGQVIGHEITHGFDDRGSQFDLNGVLFEWWDADTRTRFLDKAKCIIDQYANFTEPTTNLTLNGINTQGENIADNGGLKEAYNAYKKWVSENGPEKRLPGLKYTPEQLFWIAGAQMWCSVSREAQTKLIVATDDHSPNIFRVLGPIKNSRDFPIDFNCPEGTPMNPSNKCEVW